MLCAHFLAGLRVVFFASRLRAWQAYRDPWRVRCPGPVPFLGPEF